VKPLLVAAVALLVLAAPASAQDAGTPVVGGGSFNSAPILEAGRYHDTILPSERLFYGFRLAAGQSLRITLTPGLSGAAMARLKIVYLAGAIRAPTRDEDVDWRGREGDYENLFFANGSEPDGPMVVTGWEASADPDDANKGTWRGPGVYFFDLFALHDTREGDPPRAEIPFTFDAEILGAAEPNATATPTPSAAPTPRATPAPAADDGPSPAAAAVGGVAGLLIGVVAGIVRLQRRR
jgi:Ca-activated chloride channel homolog